MNTLLVALTPMRPRLKDILTSAIAREADMEVRSCSTSRPEDIALLLPDAVVGEAEDPLDPRPAAMLLDVMPRARVLLVAASGVRAAVYELRPARAIVRDFGMDEVLAAIRFGVARLPQDTHADLAPEAASDASEG